jgi:hypothetical protein
MLVLSINYTSVLLRKSLGKDISMESLSFAVTITAISMFFLNCSLDGMNVTDKELDNARSKNGVMYRTWDSLMEEKASGTAPQRRPRVPFGKFKNIAQPGRSMRVCGPPNTTFPLW